MKRRATVHEDLPARLAAFDPAEWPVPERDPQWRLRLARREWRGARFRWLRSRGRPAMDELRAAVAEMRGGNYGIEVA